MPVTLEDIQAARARQANRRAPGGQPSGVTLEDIQAARSRRQAQPSEPGLFDAITGFVGDVASSAGEFVAKPVLDARDIIEQGVTPTEQFPFFELPESIDERRARTSETGRTIASIAAPAAGGAAGVALAGGRGILARAGGSAIGSGLGDLLGQAGEDIAQGQVPDIDENQALLSAALGGVGQPLGELITGAPKAAARQVGAVFDGPGVSSGAQGAADAGEDILSTFQRTREAGQAASGGGGSSATAGQAGASSAGGAGARGGRNKFAEQIQALDDAGIPLTPGQRSGNTAEIAAETTAAPTLLGGNLQQTLDDQGAAVRSKLMEKAGFDPDDIADGVIDIDTIKRAKDQFSRRYTDVFEGVDVKLDGDAFSARLAKVADDNLDLLPFERKGQLTNVIDDFKARVAGENRTITGEEYQRLRSRLGTLETSTKISDPTISNLYSDLKGALDDGFAEGAGGTASAAKREIDRQYRNFKVLQRASQSAGADVAGGEPSIRLIANRARNATRGATEDFRRLADAAQDIITDRTPNSGTPSRLLGFTAGATGQATRAGIQAGRALGLANLSKAAASGPSTFGARAGTAPAIYEAITGPTELASQERQNEEDQALFMQSLRQAEMEISQ